MATKSNHCRIICLLVWPTYWDCEYKKLKISNQIINEIPFHSDLSHNVIAAIPKRIFKGTPKVRSLQLDNNQIACIDEQAARNLHDVEILTLNGNNLTTLPRDMFNNMPRLRALRLSDNPFLCDCHLSWLSKYLRNAPRLAPYTRCLSPSQLKGQNVADLHDQEFKCSGTIYKLSHHNFSSQFWIDWIICLFLISFQYNEALTINYFEFYWENILFEKNLIIFYDFFLHT